MINAVGIAKRLSRIIAVKTPVARNPRSFNSNLAKAMRAEKIAKMDEK